MSLKVSILSKRVGHAFQDNYDIMDLGVMRFDKYQCLKYVSPLLFVE